MVVVVARTLMSAFAAALLLGSLASDTQARVAGSFRLPGTVVRTVDGDTLDVRLAGGRRDRIRVLGIDAPEVHPSECFHDQATARARSLAEGRRVTLVGDPTQDTRDRYGRLLAYVDLPGGDLGRQLIAGGFARVYVFDRPFRRLASYRAAQASAQGHRRGLWRACGASRASRPPAGRGCARSYPTVCIPPPPPDLDCGDIRARSFRVRHDVPDPDPHHFDGDRNGIGCES
jgi:micrococcal nuclease